MRETVDKVLDYLGEKPRKGATLAATAAKPARAGASAKVTGRSVAKKARGGVVVETIHYRAPQLPSRVVGKLADKLSVTTEFVLHVSDISERTFHRRQANQEPLTEAESDRVLRIARVAREAERVFGSGDKANRWLSAFSRMLGARPLDLLATDAGARDVEHELVRIDHSDFA
jgi:putative toxin-antitoxin system antitoxin component (TIGR02293 family)